MDRERLAELFEHAIDLPPDERATWLQGACGADRELHAELERLLRADAQAADFMECVPPIVTATIADAAPADAEPTHFGAWRVLRRIGAGGMGEVWLAERNDGEFEQRGAVKQLAYPTPGLLQRFRQERQILARLEHPHIARLIDGGVDTHGAPYLVMEYVEGVPITDYARARGLDVAACVRLFLRVCEAVQFAHRNLVVHRDLKPSNIFVAADGTPKLLDFGIAKVLATTAVDAPTQTLARLLTPDYAAPEQFDGGAITTGVDVYALGVVLYELLAGRRPLRVMRSHGAQPAPPAETPPPSAAVERTLADATARRRGLRGDLDRIVLAALATDPQRRYASAEALGADLERWLDGRPIAARGDNAWYRLRKFGARNRYLLGAAAIVFAVSMTATIVSLGQASAAREQAGRADAVRKFLVGVFRQANPDENQGKPFTAHELLEKGERQLAETQVRQPAIHTELTGLIGGLYWNIGDYARAEALLRQATAAPGNARVPDQVNARNLIALADTEAERSLHDAAFANVERAIALAQRGGRASAEELSEAQRLKARILTDRGSAAEAETLLRARLLADDEAFGERSQAVADDWALLAHALDELSRYDESVRAEEQALAMDRALHGAGSSAVANDLNDLGLTLRHKGDYVAAERAFAENLDIKQRLYGADHRETLVARDNLLMAQEKQSRYEEGLRGRLLLLADQKRVLGATHPDQIADAQNMIGLDYIMLGRFAEAEQALRESIAIRSAIPGGDENDRSGPLGNLAVALQYLGRYADAEATLRETLAIETRQYPPSSEWVNQDRGYLGNLLRLQHRYPEALREFNEAIAALGDAANGADPMLALLHSQLSETQLDSGDAETARTTALRALAIARKVLPPKNIGLANPLVALARAELAFERASEAEPLLREALAVRSPPLAPNDPRVLEIKVGLVNALSALRKTDEASALAGQIEPILETLSSPYAADLRARLAAQ